MDHGRSDSRTDSGTDSRTDDRTDSGQWMTKSELAAVRRISVASADRLARRQGWRKQPGNDGRARVLVPSDWARAPDHVRPASPTDDRADSAGAVRVAEAALAIVREQVERERVRADKAEAVVLETNITLAAERDARARAEAEAAALKARERAWWQAGRWARLRAAWRGL